jgi:hypothetical protein
MFMAVTPGLPVGAQGAGRNFALAKFLLAHASWIAAEIPQQSAKRFARNCSGKPGRRAAAMRP